MGLLEALAGISIIHPVNALMRGGQAFHVGRDQGISGNALKRKLRRHTIKTHGWMILDGEIRFAVKQRDADLTARILDSFGVDWW